MMIKLKSEKEMEAEKRNIKNIRKGQTTLNICVTQSILIGSNYLHKEYQNHQNSTQNERE